jgi:hypothetical protein
MVTLMARGMNSTVTLKVKSHFFAEVYVGGARLRGGGVGGGGGWG